MYWNKNITSLEYWFIGVFIMMYLFYFVKIIYVSLKMRISAKASFLKFVPRLAAFILLIIALMEPTFGIVDGNSKIKVSNKTIYFLVDVSKSMDAGDIAPTRLEKVKNEMKKIISFFPDERFGIIAFASNAVLHTPLTTDKETLKTMIATLNTDFFDQSGTNIQAALKLGLEKIDSYKYKNETSKSLILFTDGEDFSDPIENILNDFKRKRIELIIVGVGSKRGTKIYNRNGKPLKNNNDIEVITKLESEYLITLASKTSGQYFELNSNNSQLSEIITKIGGLKASDFSQSLYAANPGNKFHYPLILAIIIICIDLLFSIRIFSFQSTRGL